MVIDRGEASIHHSKVRLTDGRVLHVVRSGDTGPKILFLHGYIDSWRSFERMFAYLNTDFLLIGIDQRGHGDSDVAATYAIGDFVSDALELLETRGGGRVHLVGHSLGALIAHRIAAQRPELLSSVVMIGGAVSSDGNPGLRALFEGLINLADPVPYEFAYDFQKSTAYQPLDEELLQVYVAESMKVKGLAWREALRGLIEDPFVAGPPPEVPTLVLWGEHDEVFPLSDQLKLREWMKDATFINYPDLGHAPQWEDPMRVSADIRAFVSKIQ